VWFVRGLRQVAGHLIVLRSERVVSSQRRMDVVPSRSATGSARFGVTVLDGSGAVVADREIRIPDLPGGSVAYAVEPVRRTLPRERAAIATWALRVAGESAPADLPTSTQEGLAA
jgi:hypothetical protein